MSVDEELFGWHGALEPRGEGWPEVFQRGLGIQSMVLEVYSKTYKSQNSTLNISCQLFLDHYLTAFDMSSSLPSLDNISKSLLQLLLNNFESLYKDWSLSVAHLLWQQIKVSVEKKLLPGVKGLYHPLVDAHLVIHKLTDSKDGPRFLVQWWHLNFSIDSSVC